METVLPEPGLIARPRSRLAPLTGGIDRALKRALDIFAALLGLVCLAPFFAVVAYIIKRDSPGPVFYRGRRVGRNGRLFGILKFRTMYECPESYNGAKVTAQGDKRVTPVGCWMRRTKINELPQLWNVLAGEMSLVGPRPEDPEIAAGWPEAVRAEIFSVRPGVTSPASVVYRQEEDLLKGEDWMEDYLGEILPSKIRLDLLYIRNRNFYTDLDVLFWTAVTLLPPVRKVEVPDHLLFWGPVARLVSRLLNWFAVDFVVAGVATWAAEVVWRLYAPLELGMWTAFWMAFAFAGLFGLVNYLLGLHRIEWSKAAANRAIDVVGSVVIGTACILFIDRVVFAPQSLPTRVVLTTAALAAFGFLAVRYRERLVTGLATRWLDLRHGVKGVGERVLIVGAGDMGEFASWLFRRSKFVGAFTIVGLVDDDPRKVGMEFNGVRILNTTEHIPEVAEKYDIGVIIYAITEIESEQRQRIIELAQRTPARLVLLPDFMQILRQSLMQKPAAHKSAEDGCA